MQSINLSQSIGFGGSMARIIPGVCEQWIHIWTHSSSEMSKGFLSEYVSSSSIKYDSISKFNLKKYYPFSGLEIAHEGGCSLYEVRKSLGRNLRDKSCNLSRKTFEVNPICTRRNETYANPFKALCEGPRGVREKVGGACGCPFQRDCERAKQLSDAIKTAQISERTKYIVCGSDWRTYRSKYHLECSRRYNRSELFKENAV